MSVIISKNNHVDLKKTYPSFIFATKHDVLIVKLPAKKAEVLSAPIKLVYSKFVLRFAKDIIGAVVNQWNQHVTIIEKIIPQKWKDEPGARILELCILHMAMSEITELGTRHQIVINEAVDLAKRFCDGSAPRIINGCLRTFIKERG
ncbi:hypothetical protein HPP92_001981 [Vanilla planifolia]|uniref:NusB/RsmB/TIM44 domain-containing protein n=1 Tax=Vanilla planifolia TaxID=51239 RepID=A0A835VII2_VANPL|nr:hypothetical protein HPP92_001981 [Vanilla planifolia]